jgi:hypothetical protein
MRKQILHVMAAAAALVTQMPSAFAGVWQFADDFETPTPAPGWFLGGIAGFDYNVGNAHTGVGNAWVRATQGWNAIRLIFGSARPDSTLIAQRKRGSGCRPTSQTDISRSEAATGKTLAQLSTKLS